MLRICNHGRFPSRILIIIIIISSLCNAGLINPLGSLGAAV